MTAGGEHLPMRGILRESSGQGWSGHGRAVVWRAFESPRAYGFHGNGYRLEIRDAIVLPAGPGRLRIVGWREKANPGARLSEPYEEVTGPFELEPHSITDSTEFQALARVIMLVQSRPDRRSRSLDILASLITSTDGNPALLQCAVPYVWYQLCRPAAGRSTQMEPLRGHPRGVVNEWFSRSETVLRHYIVILIMLRSRDDDLPRYFFAALLRLCGLNEVCAAGVAGVMERLGDPALAVLISHTAENVQPDLFYRFHRLGLTELCAILLDVLPPEDDASVAAGAAPLLLLRASLTAHINRQTAIIARAVRHALAQGRDAAQLADIVALFEMGEADLLQTIQRLRVKPGASERVS